jgi:outer membrane protein OmpA-like peptidoglycan-associated protein
VGTAQVDTLAAHAESNFVVLRTDLVAGPLARAIVTIAAIAMLAGCTKRAPADGAIPAAKPAYDATVTEPGEVAYLIERFFFAPGAATLSPDAEAAVARVATQLNERRFRRHRVSVEGHSDASGAADRNLQLSDARAEAVARLLIQYGVERDRIRSRGFGDTRPLALEHRPDGRTSPEARARNRRVDIVLADEPQ